MGSFAQSLTPQGPPPGPISNPDQDSLPSATLPGQPAQPSVSWNPAQPSGPANQTPDDQKQGMFHKLFSKLSGQDVQYDVDPSTGQMLAKPVREKPGELFRNILAAGLMGSEGIGPSHGEHTFAQGLLAGAGAGVKESRDMAEKQDAARRQQAQQNYENQLRANQEKREDQKMGMQEQLNKAAVARDNAETVAQQMIVFEHRKEDTNQAADFGLASHASLRQGYENLGIQPVEGMSHLDASTGQKMLEDEANQGASAKYHIVITGKRSTFDKDGNPLGVENTYSAFPRMNKVPETLVDEMKQNGWDNPKSQNYGAYKQVADQQKNGKEVNYSDLSSVYVRLKNWEKVHSEVLKQQESQARAFKDLAEANHSRIAASLEMYGLNDKKQAVDQQGVFEKHFDVGTGQLTHMEDLDTDKPGLKPEEKAKRQHEKDLLQKAVVNQYQASLHDFVDHYKPTKDANGNWISDDPQVGGLTTYMNSLKNASTSLNEIKTPPPSPADIPPPEPNFMEGNTPYRIPPSKVEGFLKLHPNAKSSAPVAQRKPFEGDTSSEIPTPKQLFSDIVTTGIPATVNAIKNLSPHKTRFM